MIFRHSFTYSHNPVEVYWFEDRYRYTVKPIKGMEYRELKPEEVGNDGPFISVHEVELFIAQDIEEYPYGDTQYKAKCIRCSKPHGAPRKEYNLAPLCHRCFEAMNDTSNVVGNVEYIINEDGSKGSVVKE